MSHYAADPSERAKQLLAEGKIGPQFGHLGGRPRKPRAGEAVAAAARQNSDRIVGALLEALNANQPAAQRIAAARALLEVERTEEQRAERQADRGLGLSPWDVQRMS